MLPIYLGGVFCMSVDRLCNRSTDRSNIHVPHTPSQTLVYCILDDADTVVLEPLFAGMVMQFNVLICDMQKGHCFWQKTILLVNVLCM